MLRLLLPLFAFLASSPTWAKSNSWWDCFFREFELCSGRISDPEAPTQNKGFCDSSARSLCEEEEAKKAMKPGGFSANSVKGKTGSSTITQGGEAKPSKPEEVIAAPSLSGPQLLVEGFAPSGDKTVLGVDVTLVISEIASTYKSRNVRGCRPIEDAYSRVLCLDSLSGKGSVPIQMEFYRGRMVSLNYEAKPEAAVRFSSAIAVAEEKTGARAALSSYIPDPGKPDAQIRSRYCLARFPLGGGTLIMHGLPDEETGDDSCEPTKVEKSNLMRVEWAPSRLVQLEVAQQRKVDRKPSLQDKKKEEIEKTKAQLPL